MLSFRCKFSLLGKNHNEFYNNGNEVFLMLNVNIRKYRKECGLSQEEMAVKLHVVRQTRL